MYLELHFWKIAGAPKGIKNLKQHLFYVFKVTSFAFKVLKIYKKQKFQTYRILIHVSMSVKSINIKRTSFM